LFKAKRKRYGAACRAPALILSPLSAVLGVPSSDPSRAACGSAGRGGGGVLHKPAGGFCGGQSVPPADGVMAPDFCVTSPGEQLDKKPGLALLQVVLEQST